MQINLNLDLERLRQKQRQKVKTGMSMQSTVNNALNLPTNGAEQLPSTTKTNGWGATSQ